MPDTLPKLPEPDAYGPSADYSERTEPHYRADTVRRLLAECRRQALEEAARVCDGKERRKWEIITGGGKLEGFGPLDCAAAVRALMDKP